MVAVAGDVVLYTHTGDADTHPALVLKVNGDTTLLCRIFFTHGDQQIVDNLPVAGSPAARSVTLRS
jgi:hypothetical protein